MRVLELWNPGDNGISKGRKWETASDATEMPGKVPSVCWINNEEIIKEFRWELGYINVTLMLHSSIILV